MVTLLRSLPPPPPPPSLFLSLSLSLSHTHTHTLSLSHTHTHLHTNRNKHTPRTIYQGFRAWYTVITEISVCDLISYISYFWLKVRNLVALRGSEIFKKIRHAPRPMSMATAVGVDHHRDPSCSVNVLTVASAVESKKRLRLILNSLSPSKCLSLCFAVI